MYELHAAARNGDLEAIQEKIAANFNIDEKDQHARTPLHLAAWSGQTASGLSHCLDCPTPCSNYSPLVNWPCNFHTSGSFWPTMFSSMLQREMK